MNAGDISSGVKVSFSSFHPPGNTLFYMLSNGFKLLVQRWKMEVSGQLADLSELCKDQPSFTPHIIIMWK